MTVQQFWKGLALLLVSLALTFLGQTPIDVALLFVTVVAALFGYIGKNLAFVIDTTTGWAKIVSGLLVALGTAIAEAVGLIAIEGKIIWIVFFKVVGGVLLTYIVTTFLMPPATTSKQVKRIAL
jgi:hypothetical protein